MNDFWPGKPRVFRYLAAEPPTASVAIFTIQTAANWVLTAAAAIRTIPWSPASTDDAVMIGARLATESAQSPAPIESVTWPETSAASRLLYFHPPCGASRQRSPEGQRWPGNSGDPLPGDRPGTDYVAQIATGADSIEGIAGHQ